MQTTNLQYPKFYFGCSISSFTGEMRDQNHHHLFPDPGIPYLPSASGTMWTEN
jgi:hypothetical protein